MTKTSKILIINAIFLSFAILATGCNNSSAHSALFGQACFEEADCVEGLRCVERICRRSGGGPSDAAAWDISSRDAIQDIAATDTQYWDGSARDIEALDIVEQDDSWGRDISSADISVDASCCAGGCDEGMVCADCSCEPIALERCHEQGQICDPTQWQGSNYRCMNPSADRPAYCVGKCNDNLFTFAPDATCPDSDSLCNPFGSRAPLFRSTCLGSCKLEEGCGQPNFGCMPISHDSYEGACFPILEDKQIGEACDNSFLCGEGAFCIDQICVAGCDAYPEDGVTGCEQGHCVPLAGLVGTCQPDAPATQEGEECSDDMLNRPCGSDALVCLRAYGEDVNRCTRVCRIRIGQPDIDCPVGQSCTVFRYNGPNRQLGRCAPDSE